MTDTDAPDDTTEPPESGPESHADATEPPPPSDDTGADSEQGRPPHPGMVWDATNNRWTESEPSEPRTREAKYRKQLRDTEAERNSLKERLESRDRADVERMVVTKLTDPRDLWRADVSLADMVGDDGEIDTAKVDEAVANVIAAHPHWAVQRPNPAAPSSAVGFGASQPEIDDEPPTWQSVFQKARGQSE
ncbi:hypothetical protein [Mycolicibacterium psychrotolerans]|uniref:Scaffolding protein n=1 Tax=Mycolicibacterium psychrotolerans TaxID=216929 RepID=A0A7I7MEB7_9MYCO|nr:hypothetical protein [Mycolicibacterium psychrotolerans]BBX70097.1 hypothetical protein MPSYJ_35580 [Mycolicibacterium psychrotolerans]